MLPQGEGVRGLGRRNALLAIGAAWLPVWLDGRPASAQLGGAIEGTQDLPTEVLRDPYAATVLGTPPEMLADLPTIDVVRDIRRITLPPIAERAIPDIFWYYRDGLRVDFVTQRGPAPLIFVIAGTGSSAGSRSMVLLARVFRSFGFHVALLSSPSYAEFMVTASATGVPGRQSEDARDLYRVMRLADAEIARRGVAVTGYHLAGFSLGGMNAAFVAALDARQRAFQFERVVLIDPPYDLLTSIDIVDRLLDRFIERDPLAVRRFIDDVFDALGSIFRERPGTELTGEDLYLTLARLPDRDDRLEMLIGLVFRISASAMAFTTDVLTHAGYLIARDARPGITASLTGPFQVSLALSYRQFTDEVVIPFFLARDPRLTAADIEAEASFDALAPFLRADRRIHVITNHDDIILGPGDLDRFARLFGDRLLVLPDGGHGGSIGRPDFMAAAARALGR